MSGDCSAGFSTTELPMASAGASFHTAIISGKFHGTMAPMTPSGSHTAMDNRLSGEGPTSPYTLSRASA